MTGNKNKKLIIAFMCPALAVMIFFFALPVAMTIFYSFTNLSLTGSKAANLEFTGLQNYIRLFKDTAVKGALDKNADLYRIFCNRAERTWLYHRISDAEKELPVQKNHRSGFSGSLGYA